MMCFLATTWSVAAMFTVMDETHNGLVERDYRLFSNLRVINNG